jgi:excisionase family DNA binding protein
MSIRAYNPPVTPTKATIDTAQKAIEELDRTGAGFVLVDPVSGRQLPLGSQVQDLMRQLLLDLAKNRPVAIVPLEHELTPNQAADILNTSRNYVLARIEDGQLTARMVGSHRRIRLDDVLAFKVKSDAQSDKVMDDLIAAERELGFG